MKFVLFLTALLPSFLSHSQLNVPCNNWLSLPSYPSYVNLGDLDITGNKITIEAIFMRTAPYANGPIWAGDLVSKHVDPVDVNYLLRPNNAEITTADGYHSTPPVCEIELNKVYHAAMVYDGTSLKFYRNGFLLSSVAATGNMIQNNHQTRIGLYDALLFNTNLIGYINEVRIWNIARTPAEIKTYMNSSLPTPASQTGLVAYYTFNNLLNKQGNATWNGTLGGSATINSTIPVCSFFIDSCQNRNNISSVINTYTPVRSWNPCENKITVEDGSTFNAGDTVMMIQMKGAVIDSANTSAFGNIVNYKNAGSYEFNYVKSITGNIIELKNAFINQYDIPFGKVQLIRVPYFKSVNVASGLTCLPWDGDKGGVLVLNVKDTIEMNADIDVSGKGFRGGNSPNNGVPILNCNRNDYTYPSLDIGAAAKGESIYSIGNSIAWGKGASANGGGGGNGHNSGGGGGANGGAGGFGGYQLLTCTNAAFDNRGIGGHPLTYTNTNNKIFLGGGGGSGQVDNSGGSAMEGGHGGGIIIIRSDKIKANGFKIISNGNNARQCNFADFTDCHDGSGGGGAGGTILTETNVYISSVQINATGGKGGDLIIYNPAAGADKIGPGGGGGGGIIWINQTATPVNLTKNINPGISGVIIANNNDPWGATSGVTGTGLFNLSLPFTAAPFKKNIDSVRIKDSATNCNSYDFKALPFTNTNNITNWNWNFGDGNTSASQNPSHLYSAAGIFTVKLIVADNNGCKDSIVKNVKSSFLAIDAGPDDTICNATTTILQAKNSGGTNFAWMPAMYVSDPTQLNPIATPPVTTTFYLTSTNADGCISKDSVTIKVRSAASFFVDTPAAICKNDSVRLLAGGGDLYLWQPGVSLTNASVSNPFSFPQTTTSYTVQIIDTLCGNSTSLSTIVAVRQLPNVKAFKANDIDCSSPQSQLNVQGAAVYVWSPAVTLNNGAIRNPVATPTVTTKYIVKGTDLSGCKNYDSLIVNVTKENKGGYLMASAFTPNNDGKNDCYGIKYWGFIEELEFSIYNRWGQQLFFTTNPTDCWNGKFKGIEQPTAVYVYMIKAKTSCEPSVFRKGTFTLLR